MSIYRRPLEGFLPLVAVCLTAAVGCRYEPPGPKLVPVKGKVTHNSKVVSGALVVFSPTGEGRPATGSTNSSGEFQLTTLAPNDGATVGKFVVTIQKSEVEGAGGAADTSMEGAAKNPQYAKATKHHLPERYGDPEKSGLTFEVKEPGPLTADFSLKD